MPQQQSPSIGIRSIASASLFIIAACTVHFLNVREEYYAQPSALYALYNGCKALLAALTFLLAATLGEHLLRLYAARGERPGQDLLTRFFLGACAIQMLTFALGAAGLLYWQGLTAAAALALAVSEDCVRPLLAQTWREARRLGRLALAPARGVAFSLRSGRPMAALPQLLSWAVCWALAAQLALLFLIFAIRPVDQINDVHASMLPYLTDTILNHSVFVTRTYLSFFTVKGAGFGIFLAHVGDPYFWQLAMFMLAAGSFAGLAYGLRIILPGRRTLRMAVLLLFSGSIMFKFNQASLHAAHTYFITLLAYVYLRRSAVLGTGQARHYSLALLFCIAATALMEPKLSFFICALALGGGLYSWWRGQPWVRPFLLECSASALASVASLSLSLALVGMADVMTLHFYVLNDAEKIRGWISDGLLSYIRDYLAEAFGNEHFTLKTFQRALRALYGDRDQAAAHLVLAGLVWFWRKRLNPLAVQLFLFVSALLLMGVILISWQGNEPIVRFCYLLEPQAILFKALLAALIIAMLPRRARRWAGLAVAAAMLLMLKPTNSLVAPGWLSVPRGETRQASQELRDYPYKAFQLRHLAQFLFRGDLATAHARGGFDPTEPYAALRAMPQNAQCLVLGYVPQAYSLPGNRMILEVFAPFNADFDTLAFSDAETSAKVLQRHGITHVYLDASQPIFSMSMLIYAELFQPGVIGKHYSVVMRGPNSVLLRLDPQAALGEDFGSSAFYADYFARSQHEPNKRLYDTLRAAWLKRGQSSKPGS